MGQILWRRASYQLSFDKSSCFENFLVLNSDKRDLKTKLFHVPGILSLLEVEA